MKKIMIAVLMFVAVSAKASAYLDYIGKKGVPVWMSTGLDITPRDVGQTQVVHNIGLITHDKKNGSFCRTLNLGDWCVPESWVPVQATFGFDTVGGLVAGGGSSFNLMPQLASLALVGVNKDSAAWLNSTKEFLTQNDPSKTSLRLGVDLTGNITQQGHWVPMNVAFAGRGPVQIFEKAAKLNLSLAW